MDVRLLGAGEEIAMVDAWVRSQRGGTLWQSRIWKDFQESMDRKVRVYAAITEGRIVGSALVIIDYTVMNYATWDIPRGPVVQEGVSDDIMEALLKTIVADAQKDKALSVFFSPLELPYDAAKRVHLSPRHEQPEATRIVDLTKTDEEILAQMHQKGRYNIKVAQKHSVTVEHSKDAAAFGELLRTTAARDGFAAGPVSRYVSFLEHVEGAFLLLAFAPHSRQPIAGLMGVQWPASAEATAGKNTTGIYYYGASDYAHRPMMAPYLLQWEAMQHCKKAGCTRYDLLGVAPPDAPSNHPWAGISGFKEKFGGSVVTYPAEREILLKPAMTAALKLKRKLLG